MESEHRRLIKALVAEMERDAEKERVKAIALLEERGELPANVDDLTTFALAKLAGLKNSRPEAK